MAAASNDRGFSLLEVMVALAIAAIGLAAVSQAMQVNIDAASRIRQRTLATWVAANRMAELRMLRQFTTSGKNTGQSQMGDLVWRFEETFDSTPDPNIARVDIQVYPAEGNQVSAALSGYLARYQAAEEGG